METTDVKNSSNYLGRELIDIMDFKPENLKIDKKNWADFTIYYINYANKNIDSTNQLYLSISDVSGYISEADDRKFLTIKKDSLASTKYDLVFSTLKNLINK